MRLKIVHVLIILCFLIQAPGRNIYFDYDYPYAVRSWSIAAGLVLETKPVILMEIDPARQHIGALTYLGGLELTSEQEQFVGLSALQIIPGRSSPGRVGLMALSDDGRLVLMEAIEKKNRLVDVNGHFIAPLRDTAGHSQSVRDRDAEGLVFLPASDSAGFRGLDQIWVSYEGRHRLVQYIGPFTRSPAKAMIQPPSQVIPLDDLATSLNGGGRGFCLYWPPS